jgi:hypothetical protein
VAALGLDIVDQEARGPTQGAIPELLQRMSAWFVHRLSVLISGKDKGKEWKKQGMDEIYLKKGIF